MTVVVTCGPAWEPIDGMRRLTNASTGRLGSCLSESLSRAGHRVVVYRGEGSTAAPPACAAEIHSFSTNDDLARQLAERSALERVDAILHAAALCDFRVGRIIDGTGIERREAKIPSRAGSVRLELEPATKVLPQLRLWFPEALLVGWKFELTGTRDDALAAAWRQVREARTDACVLNGAAWGPGFAWCEPPGIVVPCPDPAALGLHLISWLERESSGP